MARYCKSCGSTQIPLFIAFIAVFLERSVFLSFCIAQTYIIGASVARPPLGVERQLFYIFIYIYLFIFLYIYIVSRASWIPGSFEKAWLLCCNAEGVAQCCMCMRCRPLPDTYFVYSSTICRSPLSSAARR